MGYKSKLLPIQRTIRLSKNDYNNVLILSQELGCSYSDAIRQCITFTFKIAPVLKSLTLWDVLVTMSPETAGELSKEEESS